MLLNEPPPTQFDLHFRLFGFPVRVHPLFWLVALFLGANEPGLAGIVAWIGAVFVGILVHELGHAAAMRWAGFQPWITLHGMGGVTAYNPTSDYRRRGSATIGQILISAAGPAAGLALAGLIVAGLRLTGHAVQIVFAGWRGFDCQILQPLGSAPLTRFFDSLLYISIQWSVLNLMPIYPLDGGQIVRELLMANSRDGLRQSLLLSVAVATALAVVAFVKIGSLWITLLFGYLAYASYQTYQAYTRRGPW